MIAGQNLVTNPSFENNDGLNTANNWGIFWEVPSYSVTSAEKFQGSWSLRIDGGLTNQRAAQQQVLVSPASSQAIRFTAYSKAANVTGNDAASYSLWADFTFEDGTNLFGQTVPFTTGSHDWEMKQLIMCPGKKVTSLYVYCMFRLHTGIAWFDSVSVELLSGFGTNATLSTVSFVANTVTAGTLAQFTVQARNSTGQVVECGGDTLAAAAGGPVASVPVTVTDQPSARYTGAFNATVAGVYWVNMTLNGSPVAQGSYTVTVVAGTFAICVACFHGCCLLLVFATLVCLRCLLLACL